MFIVAEHHANYEITALDSPLRKNSNHKGMCGISTTAHFFFSIHNDTITAKERQQF